jgi:hypothetical protein
MYIFVCIIIYSVVTPPQGTCTGPQELNLTSQPTFISSRVSVSHGCGTEETPFMLVAKPRQRITLEMTDFFWDNTLPIQGGVS